MNTSNCETTNFFQKSFSNHYKGSHRSPQKYFLAINKLTQGCFVSRFVILFNDPGEKDFKCCHQCIFAILLLSPHGKRHGSNFSLQNNIEFPSTKDFCARFR